MIVIRAEQMDRMARQMFVQPGIDYLRRHFAGRLGERSTAELAQFVRDAVDRACAYGIDTPTGWCRFLTVLMALGDDFDSRPELDWVVAILRDRSLGAGAERALAAAQAAVQHLLATADGAAQEAPPAQ